MFNLTRKQIDKTDPQSAFSTFISQKNLAQNQPKNFLKISQKSTQIAHYFRAKGEYTLTFKFVMSKLGFNLLIACFPC
ncbi:MAG: hypothetical protein A2788_01660 [Candidatus Abawacabacteria bacterium RIFCSPHIGHO2_01_FULL_46_8]|uniref:Uncharacterized protein n=1 Tax=Candidatus Abawacabacteria bacterium RIFCSPHIGHO2_01_FULL_46_8 TaxID=1817815 RepID=A0A1F4XM65_9BACT|nr:MAG: hypothetical protein A2788_01660 [Candidatus Abawacabacteria bacterium RIFCSPHIGHO2_01_FULL_46_8]